MNNQKESSPSTLNYVQPAREWSLGAALILWFSSVLLVLVVPAIVALPFVFVGSEAGIGDISGNKTALLASIAAILPAHILTLLLAWWLVKRHSPSGFFKTLGWEWNRIGPGTSVLLTILFLIGASVIAQFFPPEDNDFLKLLRSSPYAIYFVSFVAIVTAPLVEEVVYRGILFPTLKNSHGATFSVISVTVLFALVHVPQYWPSYSTIGVILSLSLFLTIVRNISDSLLPCFVIHLIFNSLQVISLLMFPEQIMGNQATASPFHFGMLNAN